VRRMDAFFSADDKQEYLDLLSQSASKHWCLVSNHAPFVVLAVTSDRPLARSREEHAIFREGWRVLSGRSVSILIRWTNGKVWGHS
jgi:hypothetical protein